MHPDHLIPCETDQISIGQRFSRLTVKSVGRTEERAYCAVCDCECGQTDLVVRIGNLLNGETKSCGCFTKDRLRTHGLSGNPVFKRWQAMMARCYKPSHISYKNYGGRGIGVCDRWHDPENFVLDMTRGFDPDLQLDRIDSDSDYAPDNCRWVTQSENLNNKRTTKRYTFNNETLTIHGWSERTGVSAKLLRKRIVERQWPIERALTTPQ